MYRSDGFEPFLVPLKFSNKLAMPRSWKLSILCMHNIVGGPREFQRPADFDDPLEESGRRRVSRYSKSCGGEGSRCPSLEGRACVCRVVHV